VRDIANAGQKPAPLDSNGNLRSKQPTNAKLQRKAVNKTGANAGQVRWHYSQWNLNPGRKTSSSYLLLATFRI